MPSFAQKTQFFPNSVATLGVLTVGVKAGGSFKVVSSVSGKFGDPYSTKAPSSSGDFSRYPFVTLGLSDCSHCGAVLILRSLVALPFRHFGPVRSLSLWRGAHFEIPRRATLSSLWACQIALIVARCSF